MNIFKSCFVVFCIALSLLVAQADESFVIRSIKIEGLERTEMSTALSYLSVKSGDRFDVTTSKTIVQSLFDTGFFDDVRVMPSVPDITIEVVERPVIAEIVINGTFAINGNILKKVLKDNRIAESMIFNPAMFDNIVKSIKSAYLEIGKYDVDITTNLKKLEQNRLAITVNISEGKTTTIKSIRIVGAKAISEKILRQQMLLTTGKLMSWYAKDNQYSADKLKQDMAVLKAFYQDRGFFKMSVESTQVLLSPDKRSIALLINIQEGKIYKVGDITLRGEEVLPQNILYQLFQLKKGELFRRTSFDESIRAITTRLGEEGYAFAEATVEERIDEGQACVHFDVTLKPGRKVYVRRIHITGNQSTKDEVIRREMRLAEYTLFNKKKIDRSRERIDKLNYFTGVDIRIKSVENVDDQVDLEVAVQEKKQMGEMGLHFAYTQDAGFAPVINIKNPNFFGSGKLLELGLSTNLREQIAVLSYGDPFFSDDNIYLGFEASYKASQHPLVEDKERNEGVLAAELLSKIPVTEHDYVIFALGVERNICDGDNEYCEQYDNKTDAWTSRIGFGKDTRDKATFPTKGLLTSLQLKAGLPTSELEYYIAEYDQSIYIPLHEYVTLALRGSLYLGRGYGATTSLPFFKNQKAGGIGTIRGFEEDSLGEYNWVEKEERSSEYIEGDDCYGGSNLFLTSAELWVPLFGLAKKEEVQMNIFFDVASLWGPGTQNKGTKPPVDISFDKGRRWSAGVGIMWYSPAGPLEFSYTFFRDERFKERDHFEDFQFGLGTRF